MSHMLCVSQQLQPQEASMSTRVDCNKMRRTLQCLGSDSRAHVVLPTAQIDAARGFRVNKASSPARVGTVNYMPEHDV
jgi:hypothetical protein